MFQDVVFDSCVPSIVVTIALVSGAGDEAAWVGFGPPCSPGRKPTAKDPRTLVHRVEVNVPTDLTAAYIGRFGSIPVEGTPFLALARASSLSSGAFSDVVSFEGVTACGSCTRGSNIAVTDSTVPAFGTFEVFVEVFFCDGSHSCALTITSGDCSVAPATGVPVGSIVRVEFTDLTGALTFRVGTIRFTSEQTAAVEDNIWAILVVE